MAADPSSPGTAVEDVVLDREFARALIGRVNARRITLSGEMTNLRERYNEILTWVNPPWNVNTRRLDPRPQDQTAGRQGEAVIHIDLVGQVVARWAALETASPPTFRVVPQHTVAPLPDRDPEINARNRHIFDLERAVAQNQSSQMEDQTKRWMSNINFERTLLWMSWGKNALGVAVLKDGWDPVAKQPTLELYENPSQVYRGWTRRYGRRQLSWVAVVDQMSPEEVNLRFGLTIPVDTLGMVDYASWSTTIDNGEMEQRVEQQASNDNFVYAIEYWELIREPDQDPFVLCATVIANRVVEFRVWPWKRLPFHVIENEHVSTYMHGKSVAEPMIAINQAYDDLFDRQAAVIEFESGPRYLGLNMANSGDDVDVPGPFELLPLREGEEIRQLDTRVDFFPTQLHANEIREATYRVSGLTPIAWGLSPRAQTSGRALSTEWRAVEIPLAGRLVNLTPDLIDVFRNWWDYAEAYDPDYAKIAKGYRQFELVWEPLDVRDSTEKTLEIIQKLQANIIDPEMAMEKTGVENVDEVMARIKAYLLDPVYNPLRYQQYLILQQLEVSIQMARLQLQAAQQQAGQQQPEALPPPEALAQEGSTAATQGAQGAGGPVTSAQNQPGQVPGGGGVPIQTSILSQTPLVGGIGNRAIVPVGGQAGPPTNGQQPR